VSGTLEVSTALLTRLFAASPGAAVDPARTKLDNQAFAPGTARWYQTYFMPGEPTAADIGCTAPNRHVGIFQVDVYDPNGSGTKLLATEAERIAACFKRGTGLSYSGIIVMCEKSWVIKNVSQDDAAFYKQSVRVSWWADVPN